MMTTGSAVETPRSPQHIEYSTAAREFLAEYFVSFLGRGAKARDHKGTKYQDILDPFNMSQTFTGYQEDAWQHAPYNDTHEAITALINSGDPDKKALGKVIYARLANRVKKTLAFVGLATGDQKEVEKYLSAIPTASDEMIAYTSQAPVSYLEEHLYNMAEAIASTDETATIDYALPHALNNVPGGRTSNMAGEMTFSLNDIQADLALPAIQGRYDELLNCPTKDFLRIFTEYRHTQDPTTTARLLAEIEKLKASGLAQDKIQAETLESFYNLRRTSAAIASDTCSPDDAQSIAQLAIRGGYADYLPVASKKKESLKEKLRGASVTGVARWATKEQPRPRGPFKTADEVNQIIATGLLKNIAARYGENTNFAPSFIESAGEVTLKGKNGEMYVVSANGGKLNIRYQNPTLFKTNPGEYWSQAVKEINEIYRTIYEFYGFDSRSVKLEVPAKYKEVHIANLELMKPENCKGRMEWIGGYDKATMDKIVAAEQAVVKHFESDISGLDTAPNIIMDGPTGTGKTFVSEALMASFAEKLGPKGVATYRLTTTEQMTAQDIILDLRTWSRMKGKSILLVEDLYQKTRLLKPAEAAAVLTTLNDVAKKIADSKDKVLILNTEYLAETVKGGRAITEPHRFPYFIELKLDRSPSGIEDAFRALITKEMDKQISGIKKDSPEVTQMLQRLSDLGPNAQQSLWEAIITLPNSDVLTPSVLHDVLSVKALSQRDNDLGKVDAALILGLMPSAIADELTRKQLAEKALGTDVKELVTKIWDALQPLVEAGHGDLRQGVDFILELMRRNQDGQQQLARILLGSRDRDQLFNTDAIIKLNEIAEGEITIPPEENPSV